MSSFSARTMARTMSLQKKKAASLIQIQSSAHVTRSGNVPNINKTMTTSHLFSSSISFFCEGGTKRLRKSIWSTLGHLISSLQAKIILGRLTVLSGRMRQLSAAGYTQCSHSSRETFLWSDTFKWYHHTVTSGSEAGASAECQQCETHKSEPFLTFSVSDIYGSTQTDDGELL